MNELKPLDLEETKSESRKITYLSIKPEVLASTLTAEKVRRWFDNKGFKSIVVEYPNLLTEDGKRELEKVISSKDIYTYKTVWIEEVKKENE